MLQMPLGICASQPPFHSERGQRTEVHCICSVMAFSLVFQFILTYESRGTSSSLKRNLLVKGCSQNPVENFFYSILQAGTYLAIFYVTLSFPIISCHSLFYCHFSKSKYVVVPRKITKTVAGGFLVQKYKYGLLS